VALVLGGMMSVWVTGRRWVNKRLAASTISFDTFRTNLKLVPRTDKIGIFFVRGPSTRVIPLAASRYLELFDNFPSKVFFFHHYSCDPICEAERL